MTSIPILQIAPAQREALHARGLTDEEMVQLTPLERQQFIASFTPEEGQKLFNGGGGSLASNRAAPEAPQPKPDSPKVRGFIPNEPIPNRDAPDAPEQNNSTIFLEKLRRDGPWLLTAIVPDGSTTTSTARTTDQVEALVREHDGKRNLYYSVNPTRTAMSKKAAKTDIAAIEFIHFDGDPRDDETSEQAKARYLKAIKQFTEETGIKFTFGVDSGNGIHGLIRLTKKTELGPPVKDEKGKFKFSNEDQAKIDDAEARILALTLRLGGDRGTQNIDRILRLPDTTNLPNAKKRKAGRTECQAKLLWFDDVSYPLDAFPLAAPDPFKVPKGLAPDGEYEVLGERLNKPRDESPSGYGFRFMRDCRAQGMTYDNARAAILADNTTAGEWARRADVDERQLKRAWDHSTANTTTTLHNDDLSEQWKKLNSEAIRRYSDWVPDIFPTATSDDHIKNFGNQTPIDIVKEHLHKNFPAAVRWLAQKLGLNPNDYLPKLKSSGSGDPAVDAEIARLEKLSIVEFERERETVAKKLGVRVGTLEKLVAQKRTPLPEAGEAGEGGLEDTVALEFSAKYADNLRYVHLWGKWLWWDNVRWVPEETLFAFHLARELCRNHGDAQHKTVAAVVGLARTDRRQAAMTEQWDTDPWLLGTPKGTINLHTGKLSPPKPTDYITKITAVAPSDEPPCDSCPLWLTFLNRVTNGNEKLQDYLQRVCGYSLTGDTTEDALFFHYGKGGNGKSVFLDTISGILSSYHEAADMELFIITYNDRHPTDLASLRGARLVTAVESEEGKRWAEAKLKQMTGGDPIKARFMRQDFFTYIPQFKLQFAGNHKPAFRNVDQAIRRRFHLIPWLVTIPEQEKDKDLSDKLKAEWPEILRWMIDGCLEWQRIGLNPPKIVADATNEYLESQDTVQNFFDDCCIIAKDQNDTFAHIWDGYVDWCEDAKEYIGTKKAFGQKLKDKGFQSIEQGADHTVTYLGIHCTRENAKKLREEALRNAQQTRWNAPPDYEGN
jgi:putative DNA primase/helicase